MYGELVGLLQMGDHSKPRVSLLTAQQKCVLRSYEGATLGICFGHCATDGVVLDILSIGVVYR